MGSPGTAAAAARAQVPVSGPQASTGQERVVRNLVCAAHRHPVEVSASEPRLRLGHDTLAPPAGLERGWSVAATARGMLAERNAASRLDLSNPAPTQQALMTLEWINTPAVDRDLAHCACRFG